MFLPSLLLLELAVLGWFALTTAVIMSPEKWERDRADMSSGLTHGLHLDDHPTAGMSHLSPYKENLSAFVVSTKNQKVFIFVELYAFFFFLI